MPAQLEVESRPAAEASARERAGREVHLGDGELVACDGVVASECGATHPSIRQRKIGRIIEHAPDHRRLTLGIPTRPREQPLTTADRRAGKTTKDRNDWFGTRCRWTHRRPWPVLLADVRFQSTSRFFGGATRGTKGNVDPLRQDALPGKIGLSRAVIFQARSQPSARGQRLMRPWGEHP